MVAGNGENDYTAGAGKEAAAAWASAAQGGSVAAGEGAGAEASRLSWASALP